MGNPEIVQIGELQNAWNLIFTFVAFGFLAFVIIRVLKAYKDEDENRMWKAILWGIPSAILIWRAMDVVDFFLKLWDKIV